MLKTSIDALNHNGYSIIPNIYTTIQISQILKVISTYQECHKQDIYSIRQLVKAVPSLKPLIFTDKLKQILEYNFKQKAFLCKSIYFNKTEHSNWFVSYHQDLSISVQNKIETKGYTQWTEKKGQLGVIPPTSILNNILTIRIHLDDMTKDNGPVRVIPQSHLSGKINFDHNKHLLSKEIICEAKSGDIMLMKPMILHASNKSKNLKPRRVLHLEFSSLNLNEPLGWLEKEDIY